MRVEGARAGGGGGTACFGRRSRLRLGNESSGNGALLRCWVATLASALPNAALE